MEKPDTTLKHAMTHGSATPEDLLFHEPDFARDEDGGVKKQPLCGLGRSELWGTCRCRLVVDLGAVGWNRTVGRTPCLLQLTSMQSEEKGHVIV